jgi:hypothetical protein
MAMQEELINSRSIQQQKRSTQTASFHRQKQSKGLHLQNLQLLNLMCNKLTGNVPEKLGELKNLMVLELWKRNLEGSLPLNLGRNSTLPFNG